MDDLLQSQIRDNCRLALPEGLRDLMSDISREVLRAQPPDLYNFIVSYLEAMLLVRSTLCVACRLCHDVCTCACHPELEEELRNLRLEGEDLETAKNVVIEYFEKDDVKEENLLAKLFNKTEIDPNLLPNIQEAVQAAFQKHLRVHQTKYWVGADKTNATGQKAAKHTLQFYERLLEDKEQSWDKAATKIQAAYRGHSARIPSDEILKLKRELAQIETSSTFPSSEKNTEGPPYAEENTERASTSRPARNSNVRTSLSSTSLAGSFINLPKYVPYSVHEISYSDFEQRETERKNIDYTHESYFRDSKKEDGSKKIAFFEQHILHDIKSCSLDGEDDEEPIEEDIQSEPISVNENITDDKSTDYIDQELKYEDAVDGNSILEDIIYDLAPHTEIKKNMDIETTVTESIVDEAFINDGNLAFMIEKAVSEDEALSDNH